MISLQASFSNHLAFLPTHPLPSEIATLAFIFILTSKILFPHDSNQKIFTLSIALSVTTTLVQNNDVLRLLFNVIIIQFIISAVIRLILQRPLVLPVIFGMNIYGGLIALQKGYFEQVFVNNLENGRLVEMMGYVLTGFIGVLVIGNILKQSNFSNTSKRKIFHIAPVIVLPILVQISYDLFLIMLVGAFYIFLHLQILRYYGNDRIKATGFFQWMGAFNSERQKHFWFTHLLLYLGLALPYLSFKDSPLKNIAVILTIGDAMAAIVGTKYGQSRFPGNKNKSIEGFIGCVLVIMVLQYYFYSEILTIQMVIISSIICGVTEVYTGDGDNFMIPLSYILTEYSTKNKL